ncbi:unnamed protein product [Trifolium pratense]|uniref:Uncharacterized protein n=1 Tax=Trifolium pratense TaxID=57577 RepID=A0ACB0K8Q7_TRIPR|nr:unnamed protein product [Trifolium pratense]
MFDLKIVHEDPRKDINTRTLQRSKICDDDSKNNHLTKAYETVNVVFEVSKAVNMTQSMKVVCEIEGGRGPSMWDGMPLHTQKGHLKYRHSFSVKLLTSLNLKISNQVLEHSLDAALKAITMNVSPPVKVGACRAFAQLLPKAKKVIVQPQLFGLFSSLTDLLNHASYGFLAYGT